MGFRYVLRPLYQYHVGFLHGIDTDGVKHTWDLGRGSKTYMGFRYVLLPLYQYHVGFLHGIDTEGVKHKWNS